MAEMLPRTLPRSVIHDPRKSAEINIFSEIQKDDRLKDWLCLHSLNLETPRTSKCGEIDFVLLSHDGIFCLEVKGGGIRCEGGEWKSYDRNGVEHDLKDPFQQAREAMFSVKKNIEARVRGIRNRVLFGYGVAFPNSPFEASSIEHPKELIYDISDAEKPISQYLDRVAGYFNQKFRASKIEIKSDIRKQFKNILRPDFEIFEPLGHTLKRIEEEIESLTEEQYHVFDGMASNPRMMVKGQAGTGKTLLARYHAMNLAREGKRVLFLCYNILLAEALKAEIARQGLEDMIHMDRVFNYFRTVIDASGYKDEFAKEFIKHQEKDQDRKIFVELLPLYFSMAVEEMKKKKKIPDFDTLIIDEGQDMLCENILDAIACMLKGGLQDGNWYIFHDPDCQMLYRYYDEDYCARIIKEIRPTCYDLNLNCRNTKQIVQATSAITGFKMSKARILQGMDVYGLYYDNLDAMKLKLAGHIQGLVKDGIKHEEIHILYPGGEKEIEEKLLDLPGVNTQPLTEDNVSIAVPKTVFTCSIQRYKGLESKVVVVMIPEIGDINKLNDWMKTVFCVGFTRARALLCLCSNNKLKKEIEKIRICKD